MSSLYNPAVAGGTRDFTITWSHCGPAQWANYERDVLGHWMGVLNDFSGVNPYSAARGADCTNPDLVFYWPSDAEVNSLCASTTVWACFIPGVFQYESAGGSSWWSVLNATIPIKHSVMITLALPYQQNVIAHEIGHGMALAHHSTCNAVMSSQVPCDKMPVKADATSARCIYLYLGCQPF